MGFHVLPRPHVFTYLLTAVWIYVLERADDKRLYARWALPLLMLLWVNMHGMFVLGIGIWGIYLVGDFLEQPSKTWFATAKAKTLMIGGGLSLAATFLSPSGFHIWGAIASLGSNSYITSKIPEYQSANFHMPETWPYILILLLTILGFARSGTKASWTYALLVAAFAGISLYTSRMIPLFAIVVTPIADQKISEWIRNDHSQSRFLRIDENIARTNSVSNGVVWVIGVILATGILGGLPCSAFLIQRRIGFALQLLEVAARLQRAFLHDHDIEPGRGEQLGTDAPTGPAAHDGDVAFDRMGRASMRPAVDLPTPFEALDARIGNAAHADLLKRAMV